MKYVKPYFYDNFKCKGGKCSDTCCIGWEIDIDRETYELYKNIESPFGKRLKENTTFDGDTASFKLLKGDVCPFFNKDGLCDIYINLGEEYLCEICSQHPRFYNFLGDRTEAGLGLCCEEACRLLIKSNKKLTFITVEDSEDCFENTPVENMLLKARNNIFNIIYSREKSIKDRIFEIFKYSLKAQKEIFSDNINVKGYSKKTLTNIINDTVKLMLQTEPVNEKWTEYIKEIERALPRILPSLKRFSFDDTVYEQLFSYLIYRYFLQSLDSKDLLSVVKFCVINLVFLYVSDVYTFLKKENITLDDRISNIKRWSKQIEYSQENIDLIIFEANTLL